MGYLRELVEYWRDDYDWRAHEARLNELAHFRTAIDGQSIHFVHARSPHAGRVAAAPHARLAGLRRGVPRRHPEAHRSGEPRRSSRRRVPRDRAVAARLRVLGADAHSRLGPARASRTRSSSSWTGSATTRYGAQGGDWGAQVTTRIGALDPQHCAAIHLNMPIADPPDGAGRAHRRRTRPTSPRSSRFQREESGVRARAGNEAADARASRSTTRPRACSRGSSRSSARGATATATRRTRSPATSCSPT